MGDSGIRTGAEEDELAAVVETIMNGVSDERHTLLVVEPAHVADQRLENVLQPKPLPQGVFVRVLIVQGFNPILAGNVAIGFRVPNIIIDAVQNAADLVAVNIKRVAQAIVLGRIHDLPGITRRNGAHEIGIDDAALHHVNRGVIEIVPQPIRVEKIAVPIEACRAQDMLSGDSLVLQIVQGVTDAGLGHPDVLIDFIEQHGGQTALPIMAMNDVRALVALEHELERCPAEKSKPFVIIALAVKRPALKEVMIGVRFDEKTFAAMDESEVNAAMYGIVVPGDPQIFEGEPQIVNLKIGRAIVLGQDDFHRVAANFQLATQAEDDIAQAADLGDRRALRRQHYDIHALHRLRRSILKWFNRGTGFGVTGGTTASHPHLERLQVKINNRCDIKCQELGNNQAPNYRQTQRTTRFAAGAQTKGNRQRAHQRRHRGHHDRAEPQQA